MRQLRINPPIRRGVSLIELVITMTVAGVVLMMGMGTLHLLIDTEDNFVHSLKRRQTVSQLAKAFRNDIHAARDVIWTQPQEESEAGQLTLKLAEDQQVRYTIEKHNLVRTETKNQETLQSARFRFSAGTEISFDPEATDRVAVVIRGAPPSSHSSVPGDSGAPKRELRIQAVIARDHRFEKAGMP